MKPRTSILYFTIVALFAAPFCLADDGPTPVRYDGYQAVRAYPDSRLQLEQLRSLDLRLISDAEQVGPVDYLVPPEAVEPLAASGVRYEVLHENVQQLMDEDRERLAAAPHALPGERGWFDNYKRYAEINAYLDWLADEYPDLITPKYQIGSSWEGRPLYAVTITSPVGGPNKPALCFDGACHARERITPMTVMYIVDRLVQTYDSDPIVQTMLDKMKFYVVPVINPDGYEYHWDYDQWWRKTRRNNGGGSYGVDWNRNASVGWGGQGASHNPWDETYCGTAPFSEPETQAMRDYVLAHQDEIVAYVNLHSYGQLLLRPYGYAYVDPPEPDLSVFKGLGSAMATAIHQVHSKSYTSQAAYNLYVCGGAFLDWVYDETGIFSWVFELRDTGQYGFFLPPSQIIPTGEEVFAAVQVLADYFSRLIEFQFPYGLPTMIQAGEPTPVTVTILEISGQLEPSSPTLHHRVGDSGPFSNSPMTPLGGSQWQATLPATECGKQLQYYFSAETTGGGVVTSPDDAPASIYTASVGMLIIVLEDNFDTDKGWHVYAGADIGNWERAEPEQVTTWGGVITQPGKYDIPSPTYCYVTGPLAGGSAGAYDVDGGPTILTSPVLDMPNGGRISYWRWYHISTVWDDEFVIQVSNDDGATWVTVEVIDDRETWTYVEWMVEDYVTPSSQVRVRFIADDTPNNSLVEALIDDFMAVTLECFEPDYPLGDLNCDYVVDGFDIQPFVLALTDPDAYASQYPDCNYMLADINGDGVVDGFDIQPFVDLLVGG